MATNFPTSVDVLTNPVSNDSLNSPSHSAQHANANDAIEAVEDYLLNGAGKSGLVLLKTQTIGTAVNTVTVSDAFNATYNAYKIIVAGGTSSGTDNISVKLTGSGNNFSYTMVYGDYTGTTPQMARGSDVASVSFVGYCHAGSGKSANFDIVNPFLTTYATFHANPAGSTLGGATAGIHKDSNSFTGFQLISTSTMTAGTVYVFGYRTI
jgi:hypothetical protein